MMGEPRIYCPTQATLSVKASLLIIKLETDVEQDFLWRISICGDSWQRRSTVRRRGQPSAGRAACSPPLPILYAFDAAVPRQKSPNRGLRAG